MNGIKTTESSPIDQQVLNQIVLSGDITGLNDSQKMQYVNALCARFGLDPLTRPFDILVTGGKQRLYANKSTTDQIREMKKLSSKITKTEQVGQVYMAIAEVSDGKRTESSTGAVSIQGLAGESLANAYMKAETKAKRRATLSYLGLAMLDETEADSIPDAQKKPLVVERLPETSIVSQSPVDDMQEALEAETVTTVTNNPELIVIPASVKATMTRNAPGRTPDLSGPYEEREYYYNDFVAKTGKNVGKRLINIKPVNDPEKVIWENQPAFQTMMEAWIRQNPNSGDRPEPNTKFVIKVRASGNSEQVEDAFDVVDPDEIQAGMDAEMDRAVNEIG